MLRWQSITRLLVIRGLLASRYAENESNPRSTQQVRMVNKKASISNSSRHTESEDVMVTINNGLATLRKISNRSNANTA